MIDIDKLKNYLQTKLNAQTVYKDGVAVTGITFDIGTQYLYYDPTADINEIHGALGIVDNDVEPFGVGNVGAAEARYQLIFTVPEQLNNTCYQYFNQFTDYINTHRAESGIDLYINYAVPSSPYENSADSTAVDYTFILQTVSGAFGTKYNFNRKIKINGVLTPCYIQDFVMQTTLGGGLFNNAIYAQNKPLAKAVTISVTAPVFFLPQQLIDDVYALTNAALQRTYTIALVGVGAADVEYTMNISGASQRIVNNGVEIMQVSFVTAKVA